MQTMKTEDLPSSQDTNQDNLEAKGSSLVLDLTVAEFRQGKYKIRFTLVTPDNILVDVINGSEVLIHDTAESVFNAAIRLRNKITSLQTLNEKDSAALLRLRSKIMWTLKT